MGRVKLKEPMDGIRLWPKDEKLGKNAFREIEFEMEKKGWFRTIILFLIRLFGI